MNQIDKQYTLSQFYYKKKEYKLAFLLMRQAMKPKVLKNNESIIQQIYPSTHNFLMLKKYLSNDEIFLNNPLQSVLEILRKINDNHLSEKLKQKLYTFVQESSLLYRDHHIVVRKLIALKLFFEEDFSEILADFINRPRVQFKFYQQAYKLLVDYLICPEEGVKIYRDYILKNPNSIEGYDALDAINQDDKVALWQEFIQNNPQNQSGYTRLITLSKGQEKQILKLYILNNPDDIFGYEQLCLLEQNENCMDEYLEKHSDWQSFDKKCSLAYQIKGKFNPQILQGYFDKYDKYTTILSDVEEMKQSNQLIKGYKLEKLKFYFNSIIPNEQIKQKLQDLQSVEQRKLLITQNDILTNALQLLVPLVYSYDKLQLNITENINEIKYYIEKANYFSQMNQLDNALQVFDDFIQLYPNQLLGFEEKARFMKYKCKPIQIKQHWEKFIQVFDEKDPEILLTKAEILSTILKQHDKALGYLDKYLQTQPFSEQGYLFKIKLLNDQGRQKELLKTIDQYLQINQNNEKIQILKVQMLCKIYSNEIALQYMDSLNSKDSIEILNLRARIMGEKKKDLGLQVINQFLESNCDNWKAQKLKIRFLRDYYGDTYIDHLRDLIKQNPHNIKYYTTFYKMTIDEHIFYDEARDLIDQFIEIHPQNYDDHKKLKNLIQK